MPRYAAILALAFAHVALPLPALADDLAVRPLLDTTHVELGVDVLPTDGSSVAAFDVQAELKVHRHIGLILDVPWVAGTLSDDGLGGAVGNISAGLVGIGAVLPRLVLWGSFTGTVPTLYETPGSTGGLTAMKLLTLATAASNQYDAERYLPEYAATRFAFGLEAALAPPLRLRWEAATVVFLSAGVDVPRGAIAQFETAVELEGKLPRGFSLGARWQWFGDVAYATGAEAFACYDSPIGAYARVGVLAGFSDQLATPYAAEVAGTVRLRVGWRF